jgi:hypothetical protein
MGPLPLPDDLQRTFVPPRELGTSRPRDVRLTGGGRAVLVLSVALFVAAVAAGIGLYRAAVRQADDRRAFAGDAIDTRGDVVRLWRSSDKEKSPWVSYRYTVEERAYEGRTKIALSKWRALQVGATLPVRYLRANPGRSLAAGVQPDAIPAWLPFVVAAALAGAAWLCLYMISVQRRLLMEGRAAPAVVTGHTKTHTPQGGTQQSIAYAFPLLSGATAAGKSAASRRPPAIGSVICVLYDPERPRRSMPYPLPLVRPAPR